MKKNILITTLGAFICITLVVSSQTYVSSNSAAPPSGKTGSTGDNGTTCTMCHVGTVQAQTNWIITTVPTGGYVPGVTYTITVLGQHNGVVKFGFEATAEDNAGNKVGTLINTDATKTALVGTDYIGHTTVGLTPIGGVSNTWSFDWIAPSAGTGDVTFYTALNAADGGGTTAGDVIYTSTESISEDVGSVSIGNVAFAQLSIYPNPTSDNLFVSINNNIDISYVEIFNLSGSVVFEGEIESKDNKINISHLKAGTYFVTIKSGDNSATQKLVVF